jgi:opacity protein-like surface antigen
MWRVLCVVLLATLPAISPAQDDPPQKVSLGTLEQTPELDPLGPKKDHSGFWERFRLGMNASLMSGTDKIRSHSSNAVIFRNVLINDSVIRFEPRVEASGRINISPVITGGDLGFRVNNDFIRDPRKDSGVFQNTALEETAWFELNLAADIKTWRHGTLLVQADAGYYSGDGGEIEVAVDIAEEAILNPVDQDLTADDPFANFQFLYPNSGRVTQVPMSITGIWQFRPRSPFRPYFGIGFGYLAVDVSSSSQLAVLNDQLSDISFEWTVRGNLVASGILGEDAAGNSRDAITVEATSGALYTIRGGLEYNINRKWSVFMSANFIQTPARIQIRTLGFQDFGQGIGRNDQVFDIDGLTGEEDFINTLLSLPVEEAVLLVQDVMEQSPIPSQNERSFHTVFPVFLGTPIDIQIPNPTDPEGDTDIKRQTKLFVHGGDVQMDSFSVGMGFRYRF